MKNKQKPIRPVQRLKPADKTRFAAGGDIRRSSLPGPDAKLPFSAQRLARIERRKARNRAIGLSIFVLVIMLVTVLLIITVMQQAKPDPRFLFIQEGELAHTVQSTGLIIRDEKVFTATSAGLLKPLATEGSRAAKGQKLALIIPEDKEEQLTELQKCEQDIVDLQTELMNDGKGAGAQAIFAESGASLGSIVNLIRSDVAKGSLANLSIYSSSISVVLQQRTVKLMTIDFNDSRLAALETTRETLEKALGLDSGTLVCETPGIVSFKLDGLETVLGPGLAMSLTATDCQKYINEDAGNPDQSLAVKKDEPVLRISSNAFQHLAFVLPEMNPAVFGIDQVTEISIPEDGVVIKNCQVVRSESAGLSALVVFKTDRKVEWLSDRRTFNAELTTSVTRGLKVPVSALIDHDETTRKASLMIVSGGYTRICLVEVVDIDREQAIIKAIETETYKPAVSTILVANPESIEAGEFIGN